MAHRPHSRPAAPPPAVADAASAGVWEPCATCWGQRRILSPAGNGEGLVPVTCPGCFGVGERPAARGTRFAVRGPAAAGP
jgi:hypothetical protein